MIVLFHWGLGPLWISFLDESGVAANSYLAFLASLHKAQTGGRLESSEPVSQVVERVEKDRGSGVLTFNH